MSRPSEHGGGEAAPPIAGDPRSFPNDAELSRTLLARASRAALSTLTPDGYPYGSAVSYAAGPDGAPILLVSDMAEHTVTARHDPRASILLAAPTPDGADPLSSARLTLVGRLELLEEPGASRDSYLLAHPYASYYADFTDFGFWRLNVERCRYVGGFGHMSWVSAEDYAAAEPDPLADAGPGVVAHMNQDHADANLEIVQRLAGLDAATVSTLVDIDRYGVTFQVETPQAPRMARVRFGTPLTEPDQARSAVITLLNEARATDEKR